MPETPDVASRFPRTETDEPFAGVTRQVVSTDLVTVSRYTFKPGAQFPLHSHPQEQLTLVEDGEIEMTIEGEARRIGVGGFALCTPEETHGITAGAGGARIVAVIAPSRRSRDEYVLD